jgi:hypothetical protein
MEVKSINPTAKYTAELANGQHLELEMTFIPVALDAIDYANDRRPSKLIKGIIIDSLVGWDLTTNGEPIPCDKRNKELHVPQILANEKKDGGFIGIELFGFAADAENFLKN